MTLFYDVLFTCTKHLHCSFNSLRDEVWDHKARLTPSRFIENHTPSEGGGGGGGGGSEPLCICVLSLSTIFYCILELSRQCGIFFILFIVEWIDMFDYRKRTHG